MHNKIFNEDYKRLLIELININTISPLETTILSNIRDAQLIYSEFAKKLGFKVEYHGSPQINNLDKSYCPLPVNNALQQMGESFLQNQPSLVLKVGKPTSKERTLMFNFHMDTVDGEHIGYFDGGVFTGRGCLDMKGPGVALLAAIERALEEDPYICDNICILIQCVSGEEGGAMGIYGTKYLIDLGYSGKLNVFAEPTDGYFFDQSMTSMTAKIKVSGQDATDDAPFDGHNATLILGYLAFAITQKVAVKLESLGAKMCVAGIETGKMHNKVYGTGSLLFNFSYPDLGAAIEIENLVESAYSEACAEFQGKFKDINITKITSRDIESISALIWEKRRLPVLTNRDLVLEKVINQAGIYRYPNEKLKETFTCDAMWGEGEDSYTIVFGPGSLISNRAHTVDEHIYEKDLEEYSYHIKNLIHHFNKHIKSTY